MNKLRYFFTLRLEKSLVKFYNFQRVKRKTCPYALFTKPLLLHTSYFQRPCEFNNLTEIQLYIF